MSYKIIVLLATCNGVDWINDQLNSIFNQLEVDVKVFASDDCSNDGTIAKLEEIAFNEPRLILLPKMKKQGSAGKNFYRLIKDVDLSDCEYIAFADQDDIWESDKLIRHIKLARQYDSDGVSSNVVAFWQNGTKRFLNKAQPQTTFDFLFESAGPGCTFLITPRLISLVRKQLMNKNSLASTVVLHDWLIYAVCRAHGLKWVIDSKSSVSYRQHGYNVVGANIGFKAKWSRLVKLRQNWYRNEVIKLTKICNSISPSLEKNKLLDLLMSKKIMSNFKLLAFVPVTRRSLIDKYLLAISILIGLF